MWAQKKKVKKKIQLHLNFYGNARNSCDKNIRNNFLTLSSLNWESEIFWHKAEQNWVVNKRNLQHEKKSKKNCAGGKFEI